MSARFILAQISDTHIRADTDAPSAQLRKAFASAREYGADAIMMTGDLVNDERADEYAVLAELLVDPPAPLYLLPGNHDDPALLRSFFPDHAYLGAGLCYAVENFPVRLVGIDQVAPGETYGVFTPAHAQALDDLLSQAHDKPTIVALHHPPFPTHDRLFDTIGLHNQEAFAAVIARHPQVARIICGHHHRVAIGQVAHAPAIVAPSTSWIYGLALRPDQQIAPRTAEQTGYMLHGWSAEGGFASVFMGLWDF